MPGDRVVLTVGWDEEHARELHSGSIQGVYRRRIRDLTAYDFKGESPDCQSPEATRLVLGCIYRTVLAPDQEIWVIKFEHDR